jgi:hypothetical protein
MGYSPLAMQNALIQQRADESNQFRPYELESADSMNRIAHIQAMGEYKKAELEGKVLDYNRLFKDAMYDASKVGRADEARANLIMGGLNTAGSIAGSFAGAKGT